MISRFVRKPVLSIICVIAMAMTTVGAFPVAAVAATDGTPAVYTGRPALGMRALAPVTIYADAVNGDDSTGTGTQLNPYQSLTAAVDHAVDGDTVFLMPGVYSETNTNESFYISLPAITLQGSGTGNTEIEGDADWTISSYTTTTLMDINNSGTTTIKDMTISHAGEAAVSSSYTDMVFDNIIFETNYHDDSGAAIEFDGYDGDPYYSLTVTNCRFYDNKCEDDGGAIEMDGAYSAEIANNIFAGNEASYGGAIYCGDTYRNDWIGIFNNLFYENDAYSQGSCIYLVSGHNTFIYNDTFVDNYGEVAVYDNDEYWAIYYNLIAWNNEGRDFDYAYPQYSDFPGGPGVHSTSIDADPMFVDPDNNDYHIQAGSPVIGAGINAGDTLAPITDLDGMLRPATPANVAMGAYEFAAPLEFVNLPGGNSPINLTEGQTVDANPFIIKVLPTSGYGIERVEFYVGGVLIGTSTTPDADGVYSMQWDTSRYQGQVRVVAYDNNGDTVEITRNTTVLLALPYTGL